MLCNTQNLFGLMKLLSGCQLTTSYIERLGHFLERGLGSANGNAIILLVFNLLFC